MIRRIESGISSKGISFDHLGSIKDRAIQLGLKGVVFIKNDGSIKVIAEGENKSLEELAKKIERSVSFFPTENFYVVWKESTREFANFSIK